LTYRVFLLAAGISIEATLGFARMSIHLQRKHSVSTKFFLSYLKAPDLVGAILPSSTHLANALCRHAVGARHLIELGAGTGAITRQLRWTFPNVPTIIVERDKELAAALELRFARCRVVPECLHECPALFEGLPADTIIVSSLPFRSLPKDVASQTAALLRAFLLDVPTRKMVQYTYGIRPPFELPDEALVWTRKELVLRNLPPAWVWTLQAAPVA
jgi:phosphatidylethanolamine/phosphatidyl-N-methylethanolamine N-methyltransferase